MAATIFEDPVGGSIDVSSLVSATSGHGRVCVDVNHAGPGLGPGVSLQLSVEEAKTVGLHLISAAMAAESDAAIMAVCLNRVGTTRAEAVQLIVDVRAARGTPVMINPASLEKQ